MTILVLSPVRTQYKLKRVLSYVMGIVILLLGPRLKSPISN